MAEVKRVLEEELRADEASVVIAKSPCVLQYKIKRPHYRVDSEMCTGCKRCLTGRLHGLEPYQTAEPGEGPKVEILADQCSGCGICAQLCNFEPSSLLRTGKPVGAGKDRRKGGVMNERSGSRPTTNLLISGVGGQGVVLASYVLSQVAMSEGYEVKQSEVHGMSQRGGSVTSHLRFGDKVHSPLVAPGTVDILLSFEPLEAMRYVHWLKPGGLLVYNRLRVNPSPVAAGLAEYPEDIDERIAPLGRTFAP